jgi:membrane protease YdiL (CAAX protease family)
VHPAAALLVFAAGWLLDKLHYQFFPYAGWISLAGLTIFCFYLLPLAATALARVPISSALMLVKPCSVRSLLLCAGTTALIVPAYIVLVLLLAKHLPAVRRMALTDIREMRFTLAQTPLPLVVVGGLFFAFGEEFMFRGFLMNALLRWGSSLALGLSAVCFALAHHSVGKLIPMTLAGLWFAYVALRTGSIYASTLAHFVVNAMLLGCIAYALRTHIAGRNLPAPPDWWLVVVLLWIASLISLLELYVFRSRNSPADRGAVPD